MSYDADGAFAALADPTRRSILDLLLEGGSLTAGQVAAAFPQISRPAVSKHLRVLREAGLVEEHVVGREHHYRLDPAPIGALYLTWFRRYEKFWTDRLEALKAFAERAEGP